jgi:hypothetical protein
MYVGGKSGQRHGLGIINPRGAVPVLVATSDANNLATPCGNKEDNVDLERYSNVWAN